MTDAMPAVVGVLLAGGLSRRMGGTGDKPLRTLAGKPLIAHVVERARPQVAALVLNVNGDPAPFADFGLPLVTDPVEGFVGPLAGVLAGLEWARAHVPSAEFVMSFATDAPFLPDDLVARLLAAVRAEGADIGCAMSGGRTHPVFGLWPVRLAEDLRRALVDEEMRKIDRWTARYRVAYAEWPVAPADPFYNVNTPEELAAAERQAGGPPVSAEVSLGVVLERRAAASAWADWIWRPVEVMLGGPDGGDWRELGSFGGAMRFYTGTLPLRLFRDETEGYKHNLVQPVPAVYVVLRPGERDGAPVMTPFHVTASPYEAQAYQVSGDEVVEAVPMPPAVAALVQAYTDRWHVERPFHKRKQKSKTGER